MECELVLAATLVAVIVITHGVLPPWALLVVAGVLLLLVLGALSVRDYAWDACGVCKAVADGRCKLISDIA